jgi:hypothetical protein
MTPDCSGALWQVAVWARTPRPLRTFDFGCEPRPARSSESVATAGKLTAGLLTLTGGEGDVTHGEQMAYTLPPVAYGSGGPKRAPPPEPLALAEARVSQVEAELRLMLVEAQVSRLEERLSHLEAELTDVRNAELMTHPRSARC